MPEVGSSRKTMRLLKEGRKGGERVNEEERVWRGCTRGSTQEGVREKVCVLCFVSSSPAANEGNAH